MSLYNRWVPPKKSKAPVEVPKSPDPQPSPSAATPPSTLYVSTPYARYVPPKKTTPRAISHQLSPPPTATTQSDDEEPEEPKPKKRRKVENSDEERPKKHKKDDKKKRKSKDPATVEREETDSKQADDVETGIEALGLDEPVEEPVSASQIDVEMEETEENEHVVDDEDEEIEDPELDNDAAEAILAKYRTALKKSVQVETAIKARKAREGIRTPTPEPELHGKSFRSGNHSGAVNSLHFQLSHNRSLYCF